MRITGAYIHLCLLLILTSQESKRDATGALITYWMESGVGRPGQIITREKLNAEELITVARAWSLELLEQGSGNCFESAESKVNSACGIALHVQGAELTAQCSWSN